MKKFFEQLKWHMVLTSVCLILIGGVLVINPSISAMFICNLIAYIIMLIGFFRIIRYFTADIHISFYRNDLTMGIFLVFIGLIVMIKKDFFLTLIPVFLGTSIILSGINKFQDGINANRLGYSNSALYIILALISIIAGCVVILNPFESTEVLFMLIGCSMIYSGASDLYSTLYLSNKINEFKSKLTNPNIIENTFTIKDEDE